MHDLVRRTAGWITLPVAVVLMALVAIVLVPLTRASAQLPTAVAAHEPKAKVIKVKVDPRLFGLHDDNLTSLSRPGTGAIRLWDAGVTWNALEQTSGDYDFSRLDDIVTRAHANHTEVTLVLAMSPAFAVADSATNPAYSTQMPSLTAYRAFVTTVMQRYKNFFGPGQRGIAAYQVWNEANVINFWSGTPQQMAKLTQVVWQVHRAVDPGTTVVGPALVTRLPYQQAWIKKFYAVKVGGTPVWKLMNAISLNLYPLDTVGKRAATPEDSMTLLAQSRAILAKDGVPATVPIWNTEINYGLRTGPLGGTAAAPIPEALQIAYVMRTYLLNAAQGIRRVDWYAYDMGNQPPEKGGGPLGNTLMTNPANRASGALTPAGLAFTRIQGWMKDTLIGTTRARPCASDKHGTYTCVVQYPGHSFGRIYWNPHKTAKVHLVKSARQSVTEYGVTRSVKGGSTMKVSYAPVLVRSAR